jgi:hypothetical protein
MTEKENDLVLYYKKIKEYIQLEYDKDVYDKFCSLKYASIVNSYIKNCYSLKKDVPYAVSSLVHLFRNPT